MPCLLRSLALMGLLTVAPAASSQDPGRKTVFSNLREGQRITLKEGPAGRFEIQVFNETPGFSKITEIGQDYIVIEDTLGFTELRIPVTSISAIRSTKLPR